MQVYSKSVNGAWVDEDGFEAITVDVEGQDVPCAVLDLAHNQFAKKFGYAALADRLLHGDSFRWPEIAVLLADRCKS